ncbi:MAG TPA: YdeI/OmpD-associated family protein [Actinoplanes sp.]|jgi:hypothetical protein
MICRDLRTGATLRPASADPVLASSAAEGDDACGVVRPPMMAGSVAVKSQRFVVAVVAGPGGKLLVPVPFNPDSVWGTKQRHHVAGTVDGVRVRAVLEPAGDGFGFTLGPKSPGARGVVVGTAVTVELAPEGPQRDDLAEDVAEALAAEPDAGAFFDSLAQFYRRAYLRWIDSTKRQPEKRAGRIAEMVELLKAGTKARP